MSALWDLGPLVLAVGAFAALIAGFSKAGFGGGISAAATPMLALVVDPTIAVGAMLPVLMAVDIAAVKAHWRKWSWPDAKRLIMGAVPGIAIGTALHAATDPDVFRVLIGVLSLLFVFYQLAKARGWLKVSAASVPGYMAYFWGCVAGFTSFVSHSGGPPVMIYMFGRNLGKSEFLATTVVTFWAINLLKFPPYIALGFYSGGASWLMLWLLPFALIGVRLGLWAVHRLSDRGFFLVTYVFLVFAGCKLIHDGLF